MTVTGRETRARVMHADPAAIAVEVGGCPHALTVSEAVQLRRSLYDAICEATAENVAHGHGTNDLRARWWARWRR